MKTIAGKITLLAMLTMHLSAAMANPPAAFEGRRLYVSYCLLCHGSDGKGDGARRRRARRAFHHNLHQLARPFPIAHDLKREIVHQIVQLGPEIG